MKTRKRISRSRKGRRKNRLHQKKKTRVRLLYRGGKGDPRNMRALSSELFRYQTIKEALPELYEYVKSKITSLEDAKQFVRLYNSNKLNDLPSNINILLVINAVLIDLLYHVKFVGQYFVDLDGFDKLKLYYYLFNNYLTNKHKENIKKYFKNLNIGEEDIDSKIAKQMNFKSPFDSHLDKYDVKKYYNPRSEDADNDAISMVIRTLEDLNYINKYNKAYDKREQKRFADGLYTNPNPDGSKLITPELH
jgi:hypothetical protein